MSRSEHGGSVEEMGIEFSTNNQEDPRMTWGEIFKMVGLWIFTVAMIWGFLIGAGTLVTYIKG